MLAAHTLSDNCTEAFIVRIFRRATAAGFVKAFTDDPGGLVAGASKLERIMKCLCVALTRGPLPKVAWRSLIPCCVVGLRTHPGRV